MKAEIMIETPHTVAPKGAAGASRGVQRSLTIAFGQTSEWGVN